VDDQRNETNHQQNVDQPSRDVEGEPGDDPNAEKDDSQYEESEFLQSIDTFLKN
jgi:hypothetical protein